MTPTRLEAMELAAWGLSNTMLNHGYITQGAVVGSIARRKLNPKDIELIVMPTWGDSAQPNLFEVTSQQLTIITKESRLLDLTGLRPADKAGTRYRKYYLDITADLAVAVDLFIIHDRAAWGVQGVIRTGPWEFSRDMMIHVRTLGWHVKGGILHAHTKKGDGCELGIDCPNHISCPTQEYFFNSVGLPYIGPLSRDGDTLRMAIYRASQ